MRLLMAAVFLAATLGCESEEPERTHYWVIERGTATSATIQAQFDVMASSGWAVAYDDDLEASGHYVYFSKTLRVSEAASQLKSLEAELRRARIAPSEK